MVLAFIELLVLTVVTAIGHALPLAWRRGYFVPHSVVDVLSKFPSKGNVSGYKCNLGSLRTGNETIRLPAMPQGLPAKQSLQTKGYCHGFKAPFLYPGRTLIIQADDSRLSPVSMIAVS